MLGPAGRQQAHPLPERSEGEIWRRLSRLLLPATGLFEPASAPQAISGSGVSRLPPSVCRLYLLSYPVLVFIPWISTAFVCLSF